MRLEFVRQAWRELKTPDGRGHSVAKTIHGINVAVGIFLKGTIDCLFDDPKASNQYGVILFAHLIYLVIQYAMFPLLMLLSRILGKLYSQLVGDPLNLQPANQGFSFGDWLDSIFGIAYGFFVSKIWKIAKAHGACMRRGDCPVESWFIYPMNWASSICGGSWDGCANYVYQFNNAIVALMVVGVNLAIWSLWDHPIPDPAGNPPPPAVGPAHGPAQREGLADAEHRAVIRDETNRRIIRLRRDLATRLCPNCLREMDAVFGNAQAPPRGNPRGRGRGRPSPRRSARLNRNRRSASRSRSRGSDDS